MKTVPVFYFVFENKRIEAENRQPPIVSLFCLKNKKKTVFENRYNKIDQPKKFFLQNRKQFLNVKID